MRTKEAISITLNKELLEEIDSNSARELVSRSRFIEFLLRKRLENANE